MNAALDTNVVVSAAISPLGPPAQILRGWSEGAFTWVISAALLDELSSTIQTQRLRRYIKWSHDELREFLDQLRFAARVVSPSQTIGLIEEDPADNRVLETAVEGQADYIVSGDRHLLGLGSYEDISIVRPARFAAVLVAGLS